MPKIRPQLKNSQIKLIEDRVKKGIYRKKVAEELNIPLSMFKRRIKETKLIDSDIFHSRGKPNQNFHSYLKEKERKKTRDRVAKHRNQKKITRYEKAVIESTENSLFARKKGHNGLSLKDRLFCKYYVTDLNYENAVKKANYNVKNKYNYGEKLLNRPEIQLQVQKELKKLCDRVDLKQEHILNLLIRRVFSNLKQFVSWDEFGNVKYVKSEDLSEEDVRNISEVAETANGTKFKLKGDSKALETLCKYTGLTEETIFHKHNVEVKHETKPDFEKLSTEELLELRKLMRKAKPDKKEEIVDAEFTKVN